MRMNRTHLRRMLVTVLAVAATAALAPAVEAAKPDAQAKRGKSPVVTVMTRNLYLGTDLIPIALAPDIDAFKQAATNGFNQVKATDFPARAKLIAREIKRTKPDLIGLQEASLWRTGPEDGTWPNATEVAFDYIKILRRALKRTGLDYGVVRVTKEADIEGPTSEGFDVRLTMRDAILINKDRKGLRVAGRGGANYQELLALPTAVGTLTSTRGYAYADLVLTTGKGHTAGVRPPRVHRPGRRRGHDDGQRYRFRFVDTHLEAFGNAQREAQATELVGPDGPVAGKRTVIVVGDFNSDPKESQPEAWQIVEDSTLRDTWPWLYPSRPGFTCCVSDPGLIQDPPPSPFDHRIDDVFAQGRLQPLNARVVGTNPAQSRTKSGLWASDHAGVATRLRLK